MVTVFVFSTMTKPRSLMLAVITPLLVVLPFAGMFLLQWSGARRAREGVTTSQTDSRAAVEFNGFPYLRVPGDSFAPGKAVAALKEIVDQRTATLGPCSPETLIARNNFANALLADGQQEKAEAAQRALLVDMERVLPENHPDTFRCRFNLAMNLRMQGNLSEARVEMEKVYAGWRGALGDGHPRTQEALLVLERLRAPR